MPEDLKDYLTERLKKYRKEDIIFTTHAFTRSLQRKVELEEIKQDLIEPKDLYFVRREEARTENEEKFWCCFKKSNRSAVIIVIVINRKILVISVSKRTRRINRMVKV